MGNFDSGKERSVHRHLVTEHEVGIFFEVAWEEISRLTLKKLFIGPQLAQIELALVAVSSENAQKLNLHLQRKKGHGNHQIHSLLVSEVKDAW
jgi:hypothetical protein